MFTLQDEPDDVGEVRWWSPGVLVHVPFVLFAVVQLVAFLLGLEGYLPESSPMEPIR